MIIKEYLGESLRTERAKHINAMKTEDMEKQLAESGGCASLGMTSLLLLANFWLNQRDSKENGCQPQEKSLAERDHSSVGAK